MYKFVLSLALALTISTAGYGATATQFKCEVSRYSGPHIPEEKIISLDFDLAQKGFELKDIGLVEGRYYALGLTSSTESESAEKYSLFLIMKLGRRFTFDPVMARASLDPVKGSWLMYSVSHDDGLFLKVDCRAK